MSLPHLRNTARIRYALKMRELTDIVESHHILDQSSAPPPPSITARSQAQSMVVLPFLTPSHHIDLRLEPHVKAPSGYPPA